MDFFAVSNIGLKRARNEDAYLALSFPTEPVGGNRGYLFAVADGIGGNGFGDLASRMTCRSLKTFFSTDPVDLLPEQFEKGMDLLFRSIDRKIRWQAIENPACRHMGTTLSVLVLFGKFGVMAHVGDSRIYRLRESKLVQLTTDHTFVQDMIAEGDLTPESAKTHPFRNMLTRAVGTQEPLEEVQTRILDIAAGDRFLLSSDGLHNLVSDLQIASTLKGGIDPRDSAEHLLAAALEKGGNDNVTIIVVHL
jgi:protein phosphatase